jgi:hypothetical protein
MKSLRYLALFMVIIIGSDAFSQPGSYYPAPANVSYHNDTLTICPPDSLPGEPVILVSYNIYVDSVFFDNIPVTNPSDTINYIFTFPALPPGDHSFCANTVYNQWISDRACDSATVIYGYDLPFLEDWSSGSFEELQWTSSSANWVINTGEGNPAPAAEFRSDPVQTDYAISLESYPINAQGLALGKIWLDYHLNLDDTEPTGNEMLKVQAWNSDNHIWTTVAQYKNNNGSFTWPSEHINIKSVALNKIFKIRFLATGANSDDIQNWCIDNIHIYQKCDAASELDLEEHSEYNELFWWATGPCPLPYISWDDGINFDAIGTGGSAVFDVAAHWDSGMLVDFQGAYMTKIYFVPYESTATYQVRIWTGEGPDTMIVNQVVPNPVIGQWNGVTLENPPQLDASKDLWVGYHVNTPTGYPAGVDDGPAINGYGNMMNYQGYWQTLLEINPDLDYNWNIQLIVGYEPEEPEIYFKVYRQTNDEEFQLYGTSETIEFLDDNIELTDHYCYKVTMVWSQYGDTCESDPTNIVCETVNVGINEPEQHNNIKIYPNPAINKLNIESEEEIREIMIYNLMGEEVLKLGIGNLGCQIDVNRLPVGLYFVNVITNRGEFKKKVLIFR